MSKKATPLKEKATTTAKKQHAIGPNQSLKAATQAKQNTKSPLPPRAPNRTYKLEHP